MANPTSLVAKPILDEIIKTTLGLIKDAYSSARGVKEDVENLSSKLTAIKGVLEDAEKKQVNNPQLKDWLGKLKEAALDAEDVLDTFAAEAYQWKRQRHSAVRKASSKYDAAHKIKGISKRFDIIAEEKEKFHLENIQVNGGSPETPNYTGFFVDKAEVVGRGADKESIIHMMRSNEFDKEGDVSVIPIIGMGGLGKTTLAQLVFNDGWVSAHFESRMWVCVTAEFDLTRILKEMIRFHSKHMKLDDSSISFLQSRLLEFLQGNRFLLVLDDVWTQDISKWDSLRVLLKQGAKESRVLLTTRNTNVGDVIGTQPSYRLQYLSENECWSLFAKIVFGNIGTTLSSEARKELEDIGGEIVRKCRGLPLAVKAMGGILRAHTNVSKWRQIQSSEIWEIEDEKPDDDKLKVLAILKLSYDHLPTYVKCCFEYCSLFPKSHVFYKEDLVKQWIAQGFIRSRGRDTMEEAGIAYFSELLIRSFFQPSTFEDKEVFLMHDLIHDLALKISSPNCCQVKANESGKLSKQSRHVSLLVKDVEKPLLEIVNSAPKLRSLVLPIGHLKIFDQAFGKVFHALKYLRGLDLSSSSIEKLPDSIEELKLLRYLDLSRTEIRVLPDSICNLFNLQTLKLLVCVWLSGLPKDLGNLVNLRHLELDDMFWFKLSMLPPRMGNLAGLHNLPVFQVGREDGYGIEQLENMAHLSGKLHISKLENAVNAGDAKLNEKKNLHELVFEWSDRVVNTQDEAAESSTVLEDLQPHSNLKELQITRYMGSEFPAWMKEGRLQNLVRLTLNGCIKCKTLALGELPNLRRLCVKDMRELEKWTEGEYHSLDRLKVSNCPELREFSIVFPKLRVLEIKRCNSLTALPRTRSLMFLILIDNLILEDWNEVIQELVEVVNDQGQPEIRPLGNLILEDLNEAIMLQMEFVNDQGQRQRETRNVYPSFIKLLELKVINCPKLQALPKIFFPQKLEIRGCELLTTLPPPPLAERLQVLALDACRDGALVRAIPDTDSLYSLVISSISNISSLPKWPQLPGLQALFIRDCKDLVSLSSNGEEGSLRTLTSLKLLSFRNCQMLETLNEELPKLLECLSIISCPLLKSIGPKEMLKNLPSLSDLSIEDCSMLQSLPEDGIPSSLKRLQIQKCSRLTERCQKEGGAGSYWPIIAHIPDLEIDNFHIVVPSTSVANRSVPSTSVANWPVPSTSVANRSVWYHRFICGRASITSLEKEMVKAATDLNKAQSEEIIFLEHKRKKKWADEKTGHICFMLYARSIHTCAGDHWDWKIVKETSDENIEVLRLLTLCWLEVSGKLSMSQLTPEVVYEIVLVVKLTNAAYGWELPIKLTLSLPDGRVQERQVSLLEEPRRQWIELNVGNFQTKNGESGEVGFAFTQIGGHWKHGLLVKGAVYRPKQMTL